MNNFSSDAVLDTDRTLCAGYVTNTNTPVEKAIAMFKKHASILKIKELGYEKKSFPFSLQLNIM